MATLLMERLRLLAKANPTNVAIRATEMTLTYDELLQQVEQLADRLRSLNLSRLAILEDNTAAWVIVDLAGQMIEATVVPIPLFFSLEQQRYLIDQSGVQTVISATEERLSSIADIAVPLQLDTGLTLYSTAISAPSMSSNNGYKPSKITYTSGSTGQPKGVCLSSDVIDKTVQALVDAVEQPDGIHHLCTLPLATLLENIAGVYLPLFKGGTVMLKTQQELGIGGSSGLDLGLWGEMLSKSGAESLILTPELLKALVILVKTQHLTLSKLRFVAVGGGKVSPELLAQAIALGIPVYEGYGLSECGSVVALNRPSASRPGSVGKPLDHVSVSIADDGEIMVSGSAYSGYLGESPISQNTIATGDLGSIDDDGFLIVSGRKKNLVITSFGRNISPEWVEAKLCASPLIAQAMLVGDGQPFNVAIITPLLKTTSESSIDDLLYQINQTLPDYAQITRWIKTRQPFSAANDQLTANGRMRRAAILQSYQTELSALYLNDVKCDSQETINEFL